MWCRHCQQDAPAVGPTTAAGPRCARCHRTSPQSAAPTSAAPTPSEPLNSDDARREIYRKLRSAHATLSAGEAATTLRFDLGQTGLGQSRANQAGIGTRRNAPANAGRQAARPIASSRPATPPRPAKLNSGQAFAWGLSSFGATLLGLGVGLIAWSLYGGRPGLWNPGLAAAIAGQGVVIVGLLQLLASLWSAGRQTGLQLDQMHRELRLMRRVQEESAGRHAASAASFYSDLARDAGPDVLLGNLQGQVDQLSARLRAE